MQITVDGLIYLKVMDPERVSYGIEDYRRASLNLAQTTMRSEIGKLALHEAFAERDKLNDEIIREIDRASEPWGAKVLPYEIKNISPSTEVIHTLEKQMEAERARRAEVTMATAEKEVVINRSEGQRALPPRRTWCGAHRAAIHPGVGSHHSYFKCPLRPQRTGPD